MCLYERVHQLASPRTLGDFEILRLELPSTPQPRAMVDGTTPGRGRATLDGIESDGGCHPLLEWNLALLAV